MATFIIPVLISEVNVTCVKVKCERKSEVIALFKCDESAIRKMKQDGISQKKQSRRKKVQLFKPRKKKSAEEDAAIQYLQAQYDKVFRPTVPALTLLNNPQLLCIMQLFLTISDRS